MPAVNTKSRSLHHVAYTTRDPEATYDFYANKLGMTLLRTENHLHGDGFFRHFFFDMGSGEAIAFFAMENVGEDADFRTDISTGLGLPAWANHIAFRLESMEELEEKTRQLHESGVEDIVQVDHGWCTSIYLTDPNGIMVEFCVTTDAQQFAEQTPEEALRLLRQPPEEIAADTRKESSLGESV